MATSIASKFGSLGAKCSYFCLVCGGDPLGWLVVGPYHRGPHGQRDGRFRFRFLKNGFQRFRFCLCFLERKKTFRWFWFPVPVRVLPGKNKAYKHKCFGPVALGTNLSVGQTQFVPGTNPGFLLILQNGSPVCPRDKPSLSLGQSRDEGWQKSLCVLKVDIPFSLGILGHPTNYLCNHLGALGRQT